MGGGRNEASVLETARLPAWGVRPPEEEIRLRRNRNLEWVPLLRLKLKDRQNLLAAFTLGIPNMLGIPYRSELFLLKRTHLVLPFCIQSGVNIADVKPTVNQLIF